MPRTYLSLPYKKAQRTILKKEKIKLPLTDGSVRGARTLKDLRNRVEQQQEDTDRFVAVSVQYGAIAASQLAAGQKIEAQIGGVRYWYRAFDLSGSNAKVKTVPNFSVAPTKKKKTQLLKLQETNLSIEDCAKKLKLPLWIVRHSLSNRPRLSAEAGATSKPRRMLAKIRLSDATKS